MSSYEKWLIDGKAVLVTLGDIITELPVPIESYIDGLLDGLDRAVEIIEQAPTVDAVEVVRCAKCKWYIAEFRVCQFWHGSRQPNHFCGEGERKVND